MCFSRFGQFRLAERFQKKLRKIKPEMVTALEGTKLGCGKWPDLIGSRLLPTKLHSHFGDDVMKGLTISDEKAREELSAPGDDAEQHHD